MTAAIGGTALQLTHDIPAQGPKKGTGSAETHAKPLGEKSKPDGSAHKPDPSGDQLDASVLQDTGKATSEPSKEQSRSKDDNSSFESTIDDLDRGQAASAAVADPTQAAKWAAQLTLGQLMVGQTALGHLPAPSGNNAADVDSAKSNARSVASPKLLKEESVTALLATKDRLLADKTTSDGSFDEVSEQAIATPMVVQGNETHWDFRTAPLAAGPGAPDPMKTYAIAQNPIAAFTNSAPTKQDGGSERLAADSGNTATPQLSPAGLAPDSRSGQFFDQHRGSGGGARESSSQDSKAPVSAAIASEVANTKPVDGDVSAGQTLNAIQQIRNGIGDALANGAPDAQVTNAPTLPQDRTVATGQVLRAIDITLSPADLGSVRLRLSLKANTLAIEAETSKASTAKMLNDDRDSLERNLRDAGYDVSTLKITDAAASNSAGANGMSAGGSPFQDGSQARMASADRRDGDLSRRDGGNSDQAQQRSKGDDRRQSPSPSDMARPRQGNAVYI